MQRHCNRVVCVITAAGQFSAATQSSRATAYRKWIAFFELHHLAADRRGSCYNEGVVATAFVQWLVSRESCNYQRKAGAWAWGPIDLDSAAGYLSAVSQHLSENLAHAVGSATAVG